MKKTYIVSAKRTALGSFLGTLKNTHPSDLGAALVKAIIAETGVTEIDEVIIGSVLQAGIGQGIGRQVSIKGGVKVETPAHAINNVCVSGMKVVGNAMASIQSGQGDIILAGGTESMSMAPFVTNADIRNGTKMGDIKLNDHILADALLDVFEGYHMGITAEKVAEKYGITREEQDEFAIDSQKKAISAVDSGKFKAEILPITVKLGREEIIFDTDEYPNRGTSLEKLAKLRAVFQKDGTVTAGNASGINDGASMTLIASEDAIKKHNLKPLVEIVSFAQMGIEPEIMGLGPIGAVKLALEKAELKLSDMDLIELNEAFAAQALGVIKGLSQEHDLTKEEILARTNVNGGAIALGHPLGASGNRIIVTLIHEMIRQNKTYGLASLCAGGGMGTAVVLKRV